MIHAGHGRPGKRDPAIISGIQQVGIGVLDVQEAFRWYRRNLGLDVPIFDDQGEARLMACYNGGKVPRRHAILAANLHGGSAAEIWQHVGRAPLPPASPPRIGDLGILAARLKSRDLDRSHRWLAERGARILAPPAPGPAGKPHFFFNDPFGNLFEVSESEDWFTAPSGAGGALGGICGCLIGVSGIDASRRLYSGILGYDRVIHEGTGCYGDLAPLPGGGERVRRVLLTHGEARRGAFSRLLGFSSIELIQALSGTPRKIFQDRYWGDPGFIHLCFDVRGMDELREECGRNGFPFAVDSAGSYGMGAAAGRFAYLEDPDGTLIELVETHRMPVVKKLGLYLDLRRRNAERPLPDLLLKALALMRVRD